MTQLVYIEPARLDAEPFTTSKTIADATGITHRKLKVTISKHQKALDTFGKVAQYGATLESGQTEIGFRLSEQQATLLITFLKNTPAVVAFKTELVRQFFIMRDELQRRQINRELGKPAHRELADAIHDRGGDRWAYKSHMGLCLKMVTGMTARQLRTARNASKTATANDYLTADEMAALNALKVKVAVLVDLGMDYHQVKAVLNNSKLARLSA